MGIFLVPIAPVIVSFGIYLFLLFCCFGFSSTNQYDRLIESYGVIQWGNLSLHTLGMLVSFVEAIILAAITFWLFYKIEGVAPKYFGFVWSWGEGGWEKNLKLNFKILLVVILLFVVLANLFHYFWGSKENFTVTFSYNGNLGKVGISNQFSGPFLEEIIFRGMYCMLLVRYGVKWHYTILITGIVFGLVHAFNFKPSVFEHAIHVSFATIVGWFLGWIFYKTRTLIVPILWHYAINIFIYFGVLRPDLLGKISSYLII